MGKRGDELRKLIKEFPPPEGVKEILDGLKTESDRGVALIGAALLEGILERLILKALKNDSPDLRNQLMAVGGPLGDLHSKSIIAFGFGVINRNVEHELRIVRSVRNVFAHAISSVTFETPEISREIERSGIVAIVRENSPIRLPVERARADFIKLITLLSVLMNLEVKYAAEKPISTVLGM